MQLFIAYAENDTVQVTIIVEALRKMGHEVWFGISIGPYVDQWQNQLREPIEASEGFIYAISPSSVRNEWCLWEFSIAAQLNKPIIPLLLEDIPLPPALRDRQFVDLRLGLTNLSKKALKAALIDMSLRVDPELVPIVEPSGVPVQAIQYSLSKRSVNALTQIIPEPNHNPQKTAIFLAIILIVALFASIVITLQNKPKWDALPHIKQGEQAYQDGHLEESANEFEIAASIQPDNPDIYFNLGVVYDHLGKYELDPVMNYKTKAMR